MTYQLPSHTQTPLTGEISNFPDTGCVIVLTGYHKLEEAWGEIITTEFKKRMKDPGGKVTFYSVKHPNRTESSRDSSEALAEIAEFLKTCGKIELIIDIHNHLVAEGEQVRNVWSVCVEDQDTAKIIQETIDGIRILEFDAFSRERTGGESLPYAVSEPSLPSGSVEKYLAGDITSEMQEAINDTVCFITILANIILDASYKKALSTKQQENEQ